MKVYVDANDIGKTVTYKEEYGKRQYLYVHDNEGFIFKDLSDYTKQVRKEVVEKVYKVLEQAVPKDLSWSWAVITKELDKLQGE